MEKIAHNHKLIIFGIQLICKFMIFLKKDRDLRIPCKWMTYILILKFKSVHIGYRDRGFKIGYRDQGFKTKNTLQKVSTSGQFLVFDM